MAAVKVLVTGATGDTGGYTITELLARGHQVRALAHKPDERSKKLQERGVEVVYGDLLDFGQVGQLDGRGSLTPNDWPPPLRPDSSPGSVRRPGSPKVVCSPTGRHSRRGGHSSP